MYKFTLVIKLSGEVANWLSCMVVLAS